MKKIMCLIAALLMCVAAAGSAFAAESTFVPSIGYKDGPESDSAILSPADPGFWEENVDQCLVVSSISDAREKSTDITQEARNLLLDVYEKLEEAVMELPVLDENFVVRELVDVSFKQTPCIGAEHLHEEELRKEGIVITIVFELGVKADEKVRVFSYHDGRWDEAESVTNNGDGTITCVLEHFCPVAFCVEVKESEEPPVGGDEEPTDPPVDPSAPPATGDTVGEDLTLWIILMVISCAGIFFLLIFRRRGKE